MPYVPTFVSTGKALPTMADLRLAFRNASDPDIAKRDSRMLQSISAAIPVADGDVFADMNTRRNALLGYDCTVEAQIPLGQTSAPDVEVQRANEIFSRYDRCGLDEERGTMLNGLFSGILSIDLLFSPGAPEHILVDWTVNDAVDVKFDPTAPLKASKYVYNGSNYTLQPYSDPLGVILAFYNPFRGLNSMYEGGLLRALIYISMLKYYAAYDWSAVNEKWSNPPVTVSYPRNIAVQKSQVDAVYDWAIKQGMSNGVSMPDDIKVAVMELKNLGVNIESYEKFIAVIKSVQSRIILGNDVVNISHATGTFAQSKEASKSEANHNWHDIRWLQFIMNKYIRADYTLNYGEPTTGLYPRYKLITDEGEDFTQNAQIAETLIGAGFELDTEEVSRKTGYTVTGQRPRVPLVGTAAGVAEGAGVAAEGDNLV